MNNDHLKISFNNLPTLPGVYLMKNNQGHIIYIGKAKNLKLRVSQYFKRPQTGRVQAMVFNVANIDTIITETEKEAFILEMNLIHEHYPRYNVLLKDGSHYPYIALRKGKDPYLSIQRKANQPGRYYYFGPYPNSRSAYRVMDLLNKIFPLRKCNIMPHEPCLYYHLNQCLAPCILDIEEATFSQLASDIKAFLGGKVQDIIKDYQLKMHEAAQELHYELAHDYKVIIDDIKATIAPQNVEFNQNINDDVIAFSEREGYLGIAILLIRQGKMLAKRHFIVERFGQINEQVSHLICQYYHDKEKPHRLVIINKTIAKQVKEILNIPTLSPNRGSLFELSNVALKNAIQGIDDHFASARLDDDKALLLDQLGQLLKIETPLHIELFDNSHLQGAAPVGALVVFINGEPIKRMYRRYHLSGEQTQDDIAHMRQVVYRRYDRLIKEKGKLPNLILVDGGLNQINGALASLNKLNIKIPVFGLFKSDKHQTKGLVSLEGETFDFKHYPSLFFMLVRMQDEVHRYALSFHRASHYKQATKSILDDIKGLGSKRKQLIMNHFKTIDELMQASVNELEQLLPPLVAKSLHERLHNIQQNTYND